MNQPIHLNLPFSEPVAEDPRFLQEQIITYIGNKRALLPFIGRGIDAVKRRLGKRRLRVIDLFSGTGIVARFLKQHAEHLIVNDLESYSRVTNECFLSNAREVDHALLREVLNCFEADVLPRAQPGFITEFYAPRDEQQIAPRDRVFYTRRNAIYLDVARQYIATLPVAVQKYFLA